MRLGWQPALAPYQRAGFSPDVMRVLMEALVRHGDDLALASVRLRRVCARCLAHARAYYGGYGRAEGAESAKCPDCVLILTRGTGLGLTITGALIELMAESWRSRARRGMNGRHRDAFAVRIHAEDRLIISYLEAFQGSLARSRIELTAADRLARLAECALSQR